MHPSAYLQLLVVSLLIGFAWSIWVALKFKKTKVTVRRRWIRIGSEETDYRQDGQLFHYSPITKEEYLVRPTMIQMGESSFVNVTRLGDGSFVQDDCFRTGSNAENIFTRFYVDTNHGTARVSRHALVRLVEGSTFRCWSAEVRYLPFLKKKLLVVSPFENVTVSNDSSENEGR